MAAGEVREDPAGLGEADVGALADREVAEDLARWVLPIPTGPRRMTDVRVWKTTDGQLAAALTCRQPATVVNLTLPPELEPLRQLHDKVVAQMEACDVAPQSSTKGNSARSM